MRFEGVLVKEISPMNSRSDGELRRTKQIPRRSRRNGYEPVLKMGEEIPKM